MLLLDKNYFDLLSLPATFEVDSALLESNYRSLLATVHPDRFVADSPEQRRLAMQAATLVNEAWRCLRDPVERAGYLCRLAGHPVDTNARSAASAEFLAEQMAWRETLEEACSNSDLPAIAELSATVAAAREAMLEQLRLLIDVEPDHQRAAGFVAQLMYVDRLADQLEDALDPDH